jgi:hypothetical protein
MTLVLAGASDARAATIVVGPTDDAQNGGFDDTGCTLRDAVQAANTNSPLPITNDCPTADGAGHDTIVLQGGATYEFSLFGVDDANQLGDLDINSEVTIQSTGPGLATIDAATNPTVDITNKDRVIQVLPTSGGVTLRRLRIFDGLEHRGGGGGGIRSEAPLTLVDSEVVGNAVAQSNGADSTPFGGGIYGESGLVTLVNTTVAENVVDDIGEESAPGGGVMVYNADLAATNSTISGNTAVENVGANLDAQGGGIYTLFGDVSLTNATVTDNDATGRAGAGDGGGIYNYGGSVSISGSIVAGNAATDSHADCYGGVTSTGGNLLQSPGPAFGCPISGPNDITGVPANLGILANYGGPTRTHILNPASQAINRGGSCPATDQRGFFRFNVPPCDAGAFEAGASATPPPVPVTPAPTPAATPTATGQRAAALAKCKKKKSKNAKRKCRRKAAKLPV